MSFARIILRLLWWRDCFTKFPITYSCFRSCNAGKVLIHVMTPFYFCHFGNTHVSMILQKMLSVLCRMVFASKSTINHHQYRSCRKKCHLENTNDLDLNRYQNTSFGATTNSGKFRSLGNAFKNLTLYYGICSC
jgi:hypothetical protein